MADNQIPIQSAHANRVTPLDANTKVSPSNPFYPPMNLLFTGLTTNCVFSLSSLSAHFTADGIPSIQWVGVIFRLIPHLCVCVCVFIGVREEHRATYCMCVQHIYCNTLRLS